MIWHLDIWDFAGQKPFEVLQHMFLTAKRCAYIIVFDATKLLTSQYNDEFCDADGKNHDLDTGCSYFRAFESWLNIVQEVVGDDISVPAYAVGTHIDGIPVEKRDQELAKIEEFIWSSADKRASTRISGRSSSSTTPYPEVRLKILKFPPCVLSSSTELKTTALRQSL